MTCPESFDRIQNLQITNQEPRGPRMPMRIPVLLLWDENGGERSEQAHTVTIAGLVAHFGPLALFGWVRAYSFTAKVKPFMPASYIVSRTM